MTLCLNEFEFLFNQSQYWGIICAVKKKEACGLCVGCYAQKWNDWKGQMSFEELRWRQRGRVSPSRHWKHVWVRNELYYKSEGPALLPPCLQVFDWARDPFLEISFRGINNNDLGLKHLEKGWARFTFNTPWVSHAYSLSRQLTRSQCDKPFK